MVKNEVLCFRQKSNKSILSSEHFKVGKEIKQYPRWPKFFFHKLLNDNSCNRIGQTIWAIVGLPEILVPPYLMCMSISSVSKLVLYKSLFKCARIGFFLNSDTSDFANKIWHSWVWNCARLNNKKKTQVVSQTLLILTLVCRCRLNYYV